MNQHEHLSSVQMMRLAERYMAPLYFPGEQVSDCKLGEIKHRKSSVTVAYELVTASNHTSPVISHRRAFYRHYADGSAEARSKRMPGRVTFVPEADGYMWMLPDDPKMPALPKLLSGDATVVNYKPEDRCTVRVGGSSTKFGKIFESSDRAERAFEDAQRLWDASNLASSDFAVPCPLLLDSENNTMWCEALPGSTPTVNELGPAAAQRIGRVLASWHCSPMRFGRSRTSADLFGESRRKGADLSGLFPGLNHTISETLDRVEQAPVWNAASAFGSPTIVPIHGAFRLRQLLISEQGVGVVDFDSVAEGDPLEDVTDVFYDLTVTENGETREKHLGDAFLAAYRSAVSESQTSETSGAEAAEDLLGPRFGCHLALQALKRAHWLRSWAVDDARALKNLERHVNRAATLSGNTNQQIEQLNDLTGARR